MVSASHPATKCIVKTRKMEATKHLVMPQRLASLIQATQLTSHGLLLVIAIGALEFFLSHS